MLLDLHAHTSGISTCCRAPAPDILATAKKAGIDGIVLTNHYGKYLFKNSDAETFARAYTEEFRYAKQCGEAIGCTVFYGIEISMALYDNLHMLVYGVDEAFTLAHPNLCDLTMEELYHLAHEHDGIVVQPHPFRGQKRLQNPAYLDGIEINCHPGYGNSFCQEVTEIAVENGLILTCGGDYHADCHRAFCGMDIPETVTDCASLVTYLKKADVLTLHIQEPKDKGIYRITYERKTGLCHKECEEKAD